ncbi:MAG: ABC transporter permease [Armatimonadota bacterium]|nr:ABC transporter permease [Armatimonadota bacterium]MDR7566817.1 ABC transporter permease [Armatimonadota bacterium]MDR7601425.1 ABC transporter permease [Armatimonadota bacterium]
MRTPRALRPLAESLAAVFLGLVAGGVLIRAFGHSPLVAYRALLVGAFGSREDLLETLAFATPLLLTALTFAVGVRAGLFNIGAEGQVYLGAVGATFVAGSFPLPPGVHLLTATLAGMAAGALWALIPALLKAWRGVHEVISTIMCNWIALHLSMYLAIHFLAEPGRAERTIPALPTARYPVLIEESTLTAVLFVAVGVALLVYAYLWGTRAGYELRLAGENPDAARYAGVRPERVVVLSFAIGGLAAGLAGASQVIGRPPAWSLYATLGNVTTLGFDGIGVALVGRNHPVGAVLAAILFGALAQGGRLMEYEVGVLSELVRALNGIVVFAMAVPALWDLARRRLAR